MEGMKSFNCNYILNMIVRLYFKEENIPVHKKNCPKKRRKTKPNNFNKYTFIII